MEFPTTLRRIALVVAAVLLSVSLVTLSTQSRWCLFKDFNQHNQLPNKATKLTGPREKVDLERQVLEIVELMDSADSKDWVEPILEVETSLDLAIPDRSRPYRGPPSPLSRS